MNVGEALLTALKEAGAKALFGIPGDYVLPFFDLIDESRILPLYTLSHEPAVGYAADAAARHGNGVGVAVVTYGAGALNLVNAVACAWAEHSPLVIISGAPGTNERSRDLLLHHQVKDIESQLRIFKEVTCAQTVLDDPREAPQEIGRVLQACLKYSRPVYIELPRNMVYVSCPPAQSLRRPDRNLEKLRACAQAIKGLVARAKRPAILADVEMRRFRLEKSVMALAEKTGIPCATTFMGKGLFAGQPSCLGTYLGKVGDPEICELIEGSDCLLMLGVIASDTNLGTARNEIDLDKAIRINEGSVFVGRKKFEGIDISTLITTLYDVLPAKKGNDRRTVAPRAHQQIKAKEDRFLCADDIADIVNEQLQSFPKMPLAVDVGDCLFISMDIPNVPLLASGYYATMGFGVPAGIGIQAATGERPLIIVGDGGFQMTGWELLNCTRSGLDPVVLVLNNGGWGMLKQFHPKAGYTACSDISYARIAETFGGRGYQVKTPKALAEALGKAFASRGKFQLIEALLPNADISTTLKNYVTALKSRSSLQNAA